MLEAASQMRDVGLQRVGGGLGRLAAPQELGQSVCRHHSVGVHDECSQQQPRLAPGQVDRVALYHDLKRPKDPNLHIAPSMRSAVLKCSSSPVRMLKGGRPIRAGGDSRDDHRPKTVRCRTNGRTIQRAG